MPTRNLSDDLQKAASQVGPASPGVALGLIAGTILHHAIHSLSPDEVTALSAALGTLFAFAIHWLLPGVGGA